MEKISVITVVLNAVDTIEMTIKSVLNQGRDNVEYIVIDGGSTDGTVEIIKKFEKQIDYWISEPDSGIYNAMNKGISLAKGDWIAFLNSGDKYYENAFATIDEYGKDVDLIYGNWTRADSGNKGKILRPLPLDNLYKKMIFCHQAIFARKALFNHIGGFNEEYTISADYDWLLRAYISGHGFSYVDVTLVDYLGGGISEVETEKTFYQQVEIYKSHLKNCKKITDELYEGIVQNLLDIGWKYLIFGDILERDTTLACNVNDYMKENDCDQLSIWGMGRWGKLLSDYFDDEKIAISHYVDKRNSGKTYNGHEIESPICLEKYKGILIIAVVDEALEKEIIDNIKGLSNEKIIALPLSRVGKEIKHVELESVKLELAR